MRDWVKHLSEATLEKLIRASMVVGQIRLAQQRVREAERGVYRP